MKASTFLFTALFLVGSQANAQQINASPDIPNRAKTKVVSAQLVGLTAQSRQEDNGFEGDENDNFLFPSGGPTGDCNVGIGNVGASRKVERDVIIVGDVINICK